MPAFPFIAVTDVNWFTFLWERAASESGRIDEVNFWQPKSQRPMARLTSGTPVFFRLKKPNDAIVGYIQPYLGPRSNHVQNGLLLTKEFHALFDEGYVTITPEYGVRVSTRLRSEWDNGHRYYPCDGQMLVALPEGSSRPSPEVLEWHGQRVFKG